MGAGGSSTGSSAKAKGRLTAWDAEEEISGAAQKECTRDAVLEFNHDSRSHMLPAENR